MGDAQLSPSYHPEGGNWWWRAGKGEGWLWSFYGNGLVNQKELSSQIIPLLLWGGKTAIETKEVTSSNREFPALAPP